MEGRWSLSCLYSNLINYRANDVQCHRVGRIDAAAGCPGIRLALIFGSNGHVAGRLGILEGAQQEQPLGVDNLHLDPGPRGIRRRRSLRRVISRESPPRTRGVKDRPWESGVSARLTPPDRPSRERSPRLPNRQIRNARCATAGTCASATARPSNRPKPMAPIGYAWL
jgi:hypothetical protein